uniref:Uncharacterized protein n=1 Tax=Glossina pallidipes TaxID=7398 RepID=A0A1A9ZK66_GLOPL
MKTNSKSSTVSSFPYSSSTLYFNLNWRHSVVKLHTTGADGTLTHNHIIPCSLKPSQPHSIQQLRTGNSRRNNNKKKLANICGGTVAHKQMWRSAILHRLCFYRMHSPLLAN